MYGRADSGRSLLEGSPVGVREDCTRAESGRRAESSSPMSPGCRQATSLRWRLRLALAGRNDAPLGPAVHYMGETEDTRKIGVRKASGRVPERVLEQKNGYGHSERAV